ncbi:MAG: 1-acyl-sn-glycerol-3-phosphate acyltransferase [Myxococcota bacterium]
MPRPPDSPLDRALRAAGLGLVRLFYPTLAVTGAPPADGPVLLVANHPNGLLDPVVLRLGVDRPVAFLAKSTLFANPLGKRVMEAFSAIPVYRAKEADTAKNEETFALCRAHLRDGGWLALFPEGISHDLPALQPLKTGAARIALTSGVEGLRVVPVGLLYEEKEIFRSRVALAFGVPIPVPAGGEAGPEAVRALTARIAEALGDVVLQAENAEIWRGLLAVARWTSPDGGRDLAAVERRARDLAAGYRALCARDPDRVSALVEDTRHFVRVLDAIGVDDPFALEAPPPAPIRALLPLLLLAPVALLGALLAWVPYRLVKPLALRLARGHVDIVGTLKALVGVLVLGATWITEAIVAGVGLGWPAGLGMLVVGPLTGLVALRWGERFALRREALHAGWLAATREPIARAVAERRRVLAEQIEGVLAAAR